MVLRPFSLWLHSLDMVWPEAHTEHWAHSLLSQSARFSSLPTVLSHHFLLQSFVFNFMKHMHTGFHLCKYNLGTKYERKHGIVYRTWLIYMTISTEFFSCKKSIISILLWINNFPLCWYITFSLYLFLCCWHPGYFSNVATVYCCSGYCWRQPEHI